MKEFEDKKYEGWRETTEGILPGLLKRNLLAKPIPTIGTSAHIDNSNNAVNASQSGHTIHSEY